MLTIRPATAADAPAVGRLLGDAFRDDPAWARFHPDPATRPGRLAGHYRRRVRRHPERADVAVEDGRILGALLFDPPAGGSGPAAALRVAARVGLWLLSRFPNARGARHTRAVGAHRPREPHWYFHDIGTDPAARGRGVGSALLRHRLELIDGSAPAPVCLEATTPGSRRLYERFGFHPVGSVATGPRQASTIMVRRAGHRDRPGQGGAESA